MHLVLDFMKQYVFKVFFKTIRLFFYTKNNKVKKYLYKKIYLFLKTIKHIKIYKKLSFYN